MLPSPNSCSYFLQELQQCLKDPDWLAQLFIKHVRLGPSRERACDGSGLSGDVASFVITYSAFFNVIPVRSAGCICMWSTVRISPSRSMWCQNLGTATLRSVGEVSCGGETQNIESARTGFSGYITDLSLSPGDQAAAGTPSAAQ